MSSSDEARELLGIAASDLHSLQEMMPVGVSTEVFGFVAQQAVEKSLKAWLSDRGVRYPFTHDLSELVALLEDSGADVSELPNVADLNPFAVEFRYTRAPASQSLSRADILQRVRAVHEHVEALLA